MLIKSIKLHYDNLENEGRIPSIELELITSKIRKLHEKSIVYNYLHYLEEGHFIASPSSLQAPIKIPRVADEANPTEKSTSGAIGYFPDETAPSPTHSQPQPQPASRPVAVKSVEPEVPPPSPVLAQPSGPSETTPPQPGSKTGGINFTGMLGLNDRILFSRTLFNGDMDALMRFMMELETCKSSKDAEKLLTDSALRYNWSREDEVLENLMGMIRSKLG